MLNLRGQGQVVLVSVTLLAYVGFKLALLANDEGDEESNDEKAAEGDGVVGDSQVQRLRRGTEDVRQEGADYDEANGELQGVDQRAQGDGQDVEITHGDIGHDEPIGISDSGNRQDDDEIEQARVAGLPDLQLVLAVISNFDHTCGRHLDASLLIESLHDWLLHACYRKGLS